MPISRLVVTWAVFQRVEHFADHFAGRESFWALCQLLHKGICLSRAFASSRLQFTQDSLSLIADNAAAARAIHLAAILAVFPSGHPFAPTARVNVYCIVPSIGLGPSIAAVANSG
jgi:hypothetical protein